jgi:hypothetical protein
MPFSRISGEVFNEVGFKNPKKVRFGEHKEVSNHFEGGSVLFLGKDFDQVVALG